VISAIIQGLASGTLYALVAVGLILVFKGSRVLNLAQGEMGALSFIVLLAVWRAMGLVPADTRETSVAAGVGLMLATILATALMGIAVERVIMRRLVERPAVQGTIATLGLAIVLIYTELLLEPRLIPEGTSSYPIPAPVAFGRGSVRVLDASLPAPLVAAFVATALLGFALFVFFNRTRFGLGVVAATSDNTVARILGIPVAKVYRFTWGVGGALSGLAASLAPGTLQADSIKPSEMTFILIVALAAAVVGGLDNINGGIVGGLVIGVVIALAKYQFPGLGGVDNLAILLVVVATLLVRPRGLLGGAGAEVA